MQSQHGSRLGTGITDDDVLQIIFREPLITNTPSTVNAPSQIGEVLAAAYHNANALGFCSRNCICLRISVDGYGLWVAFVFLDPASTNALLHWCENQRRPFLTQICAGRCPTQPAAARAAHWKRGARGSDYPSRPRQRLRRGRVERGGCRRCDRPAAVKTPQDAAAKLKEAAVSPKIGTGKERCTSVA